MTTLHGKSVLITGANGFLGGFVCAAFERAGAHVHALVRSGADTARTLRMAPTTKFITLANDYANLADCLTQTKPDAVIHIAANCDGGDDAAAASALVQANILFPTLLLAEMAKHNINVFVTTGTAWQHFHTDGYDPVNLYAASKQAFDILLKHYVNNGLRAASLHMFDTYGPDDNRGKILNLLKRLSATTEKLAMSGGEQEIDLIHADDAAAAYVQAAYLLLDNAIESGQVFAVSGGQPMTLRDAVLLFEKTRNVSCAIEWGARPYRPREVMQTWKSGALLPGWQPRIPLAEGLKTI